MEDESYECRCEAEAVAQRRSSPELKQRAVRMVFELRRGTDKERGSVKRVAEQLDVGVESLRSLVNKPKLTRPTGPGRRRRSLRS